MLNYRCAWLAGGWLLVGSVIYLSLAPHPPEPLTFSNVDKLEHGFAYTLLSLWFCQLYVQGRQRAMIAVALIGLGIGLEYVQGWTGYRTFDAMDMLANGCGVLLGFILVRTSLGRLFVMFETALRQVI
ncbi:MAG: VanZ family protein [Gallionella sp.]|nr:VanZ family protein [Gallionella sp.]